MAVIWRFHCIIKTLLALKRVYLAFQGGVFGAGYPSLPSMTVEQFYQQQYGATMAGRVAEQPATGKAAEEEEEPDEDKEESEEALKEAREWDEFKDGTYMYVPYLFFLLPSSPSPLSQQSDCSSSSLSTYFPSLFLSCTHAHPHPHIFRKQTRMGQQEKHGLVTHSPPHTSHLTHSQFTQNCCNLLCS